MSKNLTRLTMICLLGILVLFARNFFVGKLPGSVDRSELRKSLMSSLPEPGSTVSLLTVLKNNLKQWQKKEDPGSIRVEAIYGGTERDNAALAKREFTKEERQAAEKYFKKLISYKKPLKLYQDLLQILGTGVSAEGAARWMTLGLVFDSSSSYESALSLALQETNMGSSEVFEAIKKSISKVRGDAFLYQISMNLVHQMNTRHSDKVDFFGGELEFQLKTFSGTESSDSLWVAMLGMKLAQQSGLNAVDLRDYFKRGMAESKGSPVVLAEIKDTLAVYFPGMRL